MSKTPQQLDALRKAVDGFNRVVRAEFRETDELRAAYLGFVWWLVRLFTFDGGDIMGFCVDTFFSYTATPQANILQHKNDPFFPNFLWVLEQHPASTYYQGS